MKSFANVTDAFAWMEQEVDDPFIDNRRSASLSDPEAMRQYGEARLNGCCGSFDRLVLVQGDWTLIGCNFGH